MSTRYQAVWPDGFTVIWRNLTWGEYQTLSSRWQTRRFEEPADIFLDVYRLCRIEGPDPAFAPAGIVAWIGRQQMAENPFSGDFKTIQRSLQISRLAVEKNYLLGAQALIAAAFRTSFDEIRQWDHETFFLRLAQAEAILGRPMEPGDPKAKKEPAKPGRRNLNSAQQAVVERVRARGS